MMYLVPIVIFVIGVGGYFIYEEIDSPPWTEMIYEAKEISYDDNDNLQFELKLTEDNEMLGGGYLLESKITPVSKRAESEQDNELMDFTDKMIELKRFPERDEFELKYFDYDQLKDMYYSAVNNKGEKIPDKIIDLKDKKIQE